MTQEQELNRMVLIDALTSGEYKKTKTQLRKGDCFCAMGVACDIYAKETGKASWHHNVFVEGGMRLEASPSGNVLDFFGISIFESNNAIHQNDSSIKPASYLEAAEALAL